MDSAIRQYFDQQLDLVVKDLPAAARRLLDEIPLVVEDYPSTRVMHATGVHDRRQLCGLYNGIPLGQRSIELSGVLSDVVHVYREGILGLAADEFGRINERELCRQIRITILHELGHHHGMTEAQLRDLGY